MIVQGSTMAFPSPVKANYRKKFVRWTEWDIWIFGKSLWKLVAVLQCKRLSIYPLPHTQPMYWKELSWSKRFFWQSFSFETFSMQGSFFLVLWLISEPSITGWVRKPAWFFRSSSEELWLWWSSLRCTPAARIPPAPGHSQTACSYFLCMGKCKILGLLKLFLWYAPHLPGASVLYFHILSFLGIHQLTIPGGCNCWWLWHALFIDVAGNVLFFTGSC